MDNTGYSPNTGSVQSEPAGAALPIVSCEYEVTELYYREMYRPLVKKLLRNSVLLCVFGAVLIALWAVIRVLGAEGWGLFLWLGIMEIIFGLMGIWSANTHYKAGYGQYAATSKIPIEHMDFFEYSFVHSNSNSSMTLYYEDVKKWGESGDYFYLYFGQEPYNKIITFPKYGFASAEEVDETRNLLSFALRGKPYLPM